MTAILRTRTLGAALVAAGLVAAGCSQPDDRAGPDRSRPDIQLVSSLQTFESCDEVRGWVRDEVVPRIGPYGFPGGPEILADGAVVPQAADDAAADAS
ncbi:MAG TPA: hypothetical protein VFI47_01170, partial [Acidimicrobiales bacterium]|nr:hypothetical protein [Acidimicrobiales bacterium]